MPTQNASRTVAVAAVLLICGPLAFLGKQVAAENGILLRTGTVVTAEEHRLVIRDKEKETHEFVVLSRTEVTLNGRSATIDDLKPGHYARIDATRASDRLVALLVEAGTETAAHLSR